jgi:hypothetical protein
MREPDPWASARTVVVGLLLSRVRTPCGQSGSFPGLGLLPLYWHYLVPPTSTPANYAGA